MDKLKITINGKPAEATQGMTVAAALLTANTLIFRSSVTGEPRAPLCGIGICYECRVRINGVDQEKSCQISVAEGMKIETT